MKKLGAVIVTATEYTTSSDTDQRDIYRLFEFTANDLMKFIRGEKNDDPVEVFWTAGYDPGETYEQLLETGIKQLTQCLERYREERAIDEACVHWSTPPSKLWPVGHEMYTRDGQPNPVSPAKLLAGEEFLVGGLIYDHESPTKWSVLFAGCLFPIKPNSDVDLQQPNGEWKSLCK